MKKITAALLLLILLAPLPACTAGGQRRTLVLGAIPSIDVLPVVIAEQQGYFKTRGVAVKLELFQSARDRDAAFQAGALDGMYCDMVSVCIYRNAGTDLKITGLSCGEYALVAAKGSGARSAADLLGKRVAISENTLIEYILDTMLEQSGMAAGDIQKLAVPAVPVRLEMLKAAQTDAALLPEPFAQMAVNDGGTALLTATGIGLYPSVIAFTEAKLEERSGEIAAFWRAYDDAADYLNSRPVSEYEDIIIQSAGYPESMKGRITLPEFPRRTMPDAEALEAVVEWASAKGLCKANLAAPDMVAEER